MKLAGTAFLALWNGVTPGLEEAYEDWHGIEHVPERLTVPGILAAWRYVAIDGAEPGFFTLYDLASVAVLESPAYQKLIHEPSPASIRMRPHLTHFRRIVCRMENLQSGPDRPFLACFVAPQEEPLHAAPGAGVTVQTGVVAADAARHPLAPAGDATGRVWLVEGTDRAELAGPAGRLAVDAGQPQARLFRLIKAYSAAA